MQLGCLKINRFIYNFVFLYHMVYGVSGHVESSSEKTQHNLGQKLSFTN